MTGMTRNRGLSLAIVAAVLLGFRLALPEADRGRALYLAVVCLGYGHLLGGALFARRRMAGWRPAGVGAGLFGAFVTTSLLAAFALYVHAVQAWPALVVPMLALAVWHAFENDLGVGRAYRESTSGLRIAPVPRRWEPHATALGLSAAVVLFFVLALPEAGLAAALGGGPGLAMAAAPLEPLVRGGAVMAGLGLLAVPSGRHRLGGLALATGALLAPRLWPWVRFEEVFALWTLYHVVSWGIFSWERSPDARRRLGVVAVHVLPALACAALLMAPLAWEHPLRVVVFAPAAYLFWSSLHVLQTLAVRGMEEPDASAAIPQPRPAAASRSATSGA